MAKVRGEGFSASRVGTLVTKETHTYAYEKRDLDTCQKRPKHMTKETHTYYETDLRV